MRFPWVRAPSPPPWVEPSYWAFNLTFSVLFLIYMAVLYLGLQRRWVLSKYTVSAVVPIALGNILMGTALMPTCETPTVSPPISGQLCTAHLLQPHMAQPSQLVLDPASGASARISVHDASRRRQVPYTPPDHTPRGPLPTSPHIHPTPLSCLLAIATPTLPRPILPASLYSALPKSRRTSST